MAQFYHVLDWRGLPLRLAAILAAGLPAESRVMRRLSVEAVPINTLLLANIADAAALLLWRYAKDGTPKPPSLTALLTGQQKPEKEILVFRSGKDFDKALARFIDKPSRR